MQMELRRMIQEVKESDLSNEEYQLKMKEVQSDLHGVRSRAIDKRKSKKFSLGKDRQFRSRTNLAKALHSASARRTRPTRGKKKDSELD